MKKILTQNNSPTRELLEQPWVRQIFEKLSSSGIEGSAQEIGHIIFAKLYEQAVIEKNALDVSVHLNIPDKLNQPLSRALQQLFLIRQTNPSLKKLDKNQQDFLDRTIRSLDQEDFIKALASMIELQNQVILTSSPSSDSGDTGSIASGSSDEEAHSSEDSSVGVEFQKHSAKNVRFMQYDITESDPSLHTASDDSIDIEHAVKPSAPLKSLQVTLSTSETDWKQNHSVIMSYLTDREIQAYFIACSKENTAPTKEKIGFLLDQIEMSDIEEKSAVLLKAYYVLKENPKFALEISPEYGSMISNVITRTMTTMSLNRSLNRSGPDSPSTSQTSSPALSRKEGFFKKLSTSSSGLLPRSLSRSSTPSLSASESESASPRLNRKEKLESLKKNSLAKLTELEKELMEIALKDSNKIHRQAK